ncbi:hypothetical protein SUDANB37_03501 [Streptomyces sp. enrichment culture]
MRPGRPGRGGGTSCGAVALRTGRWPFVRDTVPGGRAGFRAARGSGGRACLRGAVRCEQVPGRYGVSLLTVHAATAYVGYWAWAVLPDGPWDEDDLTGIETGCALMILSGALTLAFP